MHCLNPNLLKYGQKYRLEGKEPVKKLLVSLYMTERRTAQSLDLSKSGIFPDTTKWFNLDSVFSAIKHLSYFKCNPQNLT